MSDLLQDNKTWITRRRDAMPQHAIVWKVTEAATQAIMTMVAWQQMVSALNKSVAVTTVMPNKGVVIND